jgi:glycosyltransferase involved in cell wall biosynthesis
MDLLIDGQALQTPDSRHRGIGRYCRNLLAALAAARPHWKTVVVQNEHLDPIAGDLGGLPVLPFRPPLSPHPSHAEANSRYYADWLSAWNPRRVLLLNYFEWQAIKPTFTGPRPPLAAVLYDLIPLLFHDLYLTDPTTCGLYARSLRHLLACDAVLTISEASAWDLRRVAPDARPQIVNIAGATDPAFTPLGPEEFAAVGGGLRERFGLRRDFFFFVGGFDPRKNMPGAMRAFAALPEAIRISHELVITCHLNPHERSYLEAVGRELGIAEALRLTGFVGDKELRALYQMCRVFLFPSLYEGLGLPVLEALHCGAPVVASDCSAIPEYAGPATWLADPRDPAAMARAMLEALSEPREARRAERLAFARGFTWRNTAARALKVIEALGAARAPAPAGPRRKRLAWVSPLPPSGSGIADYAAELLHPLRASYDIDLVVDPDHPPADPGLSCRHLVVTGQEALRRHAARPYDLFVYHVGNSSYHLYMLELLRRCRGLVVLHDFALGGLVRSALDAGLWPVDLPTELEGGGESHFAEWHRIKAIPAWVATELAPLNQRILKSASALLVHSGMVWKCLRRLVSVPVALVPHHCFAPPPLGTRREERLRLGLPTDAFLVCTLGLVAYTKRIPSILRAAAALPERERARTSLLVVGEAAPDQLAPLRRLASDLGLAGQVHFTGRVPLQEFWAYTRAADVIVQLRYPSRGESSGALLRALATGTPCIVSDQGTMLEFPNHIVRKVRTPHHEAEDLSVLLRELYEHPEAREALGAAGRQWVADHHSLGQVAAQYSAFIEQAIARREAQDENWLDHALNALADCADAAAADAVVDRWLSLRRKVWVAAAPAPKVTGRAGKAAAAGLRLVA